MEKKIENRSDDMITSCLTFFFDVRICLYTLFATCTGCGVRNSATRIVGGKETTVNGYPWQVAILDKTSNIPWCGGSIISNQWVITAGHCIDRYCSTVDERKLPIRCIERQRHMAGTSIARNKDLDVVTGTSRLPIYRSLQHKHQLRHIR